MKGHALWMIIGCIAPLLLIFILPALGVGSGVTLFIFIILMFGCHLLMVGHHGKHDEREDEREREHGPHSH